jgi:hypothetical protein
LTSLHKNEDLRIRVRRSPKFEAAFIGWVSWMPHLSVSQLVAIT